MFAAAGDLVPPQPDLKEPSVLVVGSLRRRGPSSPIVMAIASLSGASRAVWFFRAPSQRAPPPLPLVTGPQCPGLGDWKCVVEEARRFSASVGRLFVLAPGGGVEWVRGRFVGRHCADLSALVETFAGDADSALPAIEAGADVGETLTEHAWGLLSECREGLRPTHDRHGITLQVARELARCGDRDVEDLLAHDWERCAEEGSLTGVVGVDGDLVEGEIRDAVHRATVARVRRPPHTGPLEAVGAGQLEAGFRALSGGNGVFAPRSSQLEYAALAAGAFSDGRVAAVEAGTGTGKTLGYLVPGFEAVVANPGTHLLIATSTKALRDQVVREAKRLAQLSRYAHVEVDSYKSKGDYVCARGLAGSFLRMLDGTTPNPGRQWIRAFTHALRNGGEAAPRGPVEIESFQRGEWAGCGGKGCKGGCPSDLRRESALAADVVVTTHVSAAQLAQEGRRIGWRKRTICVVDEADLFPSNARTALQVAVGTVEVKECGRRFGASGYEELDRVGKQLERRAMDLERMVDGADFHPKRWRGLSRVRDIRAELGGVVEDISSARTLAPRAWRKLKRTGLPAHSDALRRTSEWAKNVADRTKTLLSACPPDEFIHTASRTEGRLEFARSPFNLGALKGGPLRDFHAALYTSATLQGGEGGHFLKDVGAPAGTEINRVGSPYDYPAVVRAALVGNLPRYSFKSSRREKEEWRRAVARAVRDVAVPLRGRTLVLFTSRKDMEETGTILQPLLDEAGIGMLVQRGMGEVEEFREGGNAVLMGIDTMWTGLDIPGEGLAAVVVPRLPVPSPVSPEMLHWKEHDWVREKGEYALQAALRLQQGFGRLIRSPDDRGLFVVLDKRATYERFESVINSLPVKLTSVGGKGTELSDWVEQSASELGLGSGSAVRGLAA